MLVRSFILLLTLLFSTDIYANQNTTQSSTKPENTEPPISVNVTIESNALENIVKNIDEVSKNFTAAVNKLSENDSFTPEQKEQILASLKEVHLISVNLNKGIAQLPQSVENLGDPLQQQASLVTDKFINVAIVTGIVICVVLVITLASIFYFVLLPLRNTVTRTTGDLRAISESLEHMKRMSLPQQEQSENEQSENEQSEK